MKKLSFQTALAGFLIPLAAVIFLVISGADIVIALFSAVLIETVFCLVIRVPWEEINDAMMKGGSGQYTTLTLPGAAFGKFYEDMDIHSSVLGRTLEDIATMLDPIIPWTVSGIYYSGLFNVPVAAYTPFTIIAFLSPVIAIINALFGIGVFRRNDRVRYNPFWRRTPNR